MKRNFKELFAIFKLQPDIHYLDSAATTQKPTQILEALQDFYCRANGNAGRGSHNLAIAASQLIERARQRIAQYLNSASSNQIIFTKNATESLNIIAYCYGAEFLSKGDEIILSVANHHANLVPWHYVAKKTGAILRFVAFDDAGNFDMETYCDLLSERTKIVAFSAMVNTTGVINPCEQIIAEAKKYGALTLVDAAQSIVHNRHDVQKLDCDFLVFSGHKLYATLGAGVLYAKTELLNKMPPFLYGGEMIDFVEEQQSIFKDAPHKYEGGTMNTAAIHSMALALDFIEQIGLDTINEHLHEIEVYALEELAKLDCVECYHTTATKSNAIIAFNVRGVHSHDTAYILNEHKVMLRSGHHCTQPLMKKMGVASCCRISFATYNCTADIDALIDGLKHVQKVFI